MKSNVNMFSLVSVVLFYFCVVSVESLTKISLNEKWIINSKEHSNVEGNVPGGIYSDLMRAGIIDDVFFGFNDVQSRWVALTNWTYSKNFSIDGNLLYYDNLRLRFDGLDTFATIYLNDVKIGNSENMFLPLDIDIKRYLKLGSNQLDVSFESAVSKAEELYRMQLIDYEVPPTCVPKEYRGECHANHVRKMQASFSWDWGPALPSMGIWKDVALFAYNTTVIDRLLVDTKSDGDQWVINATVFFADNNIQSVEGTIFIKLYTDVVDIETVAQISLQRNNNGDYVYSEIISIAKSNVKLWWPNGYGEQPLYTLKATFAQDGNEQSVRIIKIGFRTVQLIQDALEIGNSFYFSVNDVPIFAKGSNIIPTNILPEMVTADNVRRLLAAAADVNMNMLRVWGGGVYESDLFYTVADELGIMIWQDFMFACSMYPVDDAFLKTVAAEVKSQVLRLQYHASVVLWAGNNENEAALRQNWYGTESNFDRYKADYIRLYVNTIRPVVQTYDPTRSYLVSSPTNGVQSELEGFIADQPGSNLFGDVHFYNYVRDSWDANIYPITRFASEYGYQSLPSLRTLKTVTDNASNLLIDSEFMDHRQHHPVGYAEMKLLIGSRLTLPPSHSDAYTEAFIFYGQIVQAVAVRIETELYRRWRTDYNSIGEGGTMGALYWQLNDVWIAPTWSSIDFYGNWKMLHYYAKDFFAPIIITSHLEINRDLQIYAVSDLLQNQFNLTAILTTYNWSSFDAVHVDEFVVSELPHSSAIKVGAPIWLDKYLPNVGCSDTFNCFMKLELVGEDHSLAAPLNYIMPEALKNSIIRNATVQIANVELVGDSDFNITISSTDIALFVWLEVRNVSGRFSENGFWMTTPTKSVTFKSCSPIALNLFETVLDVTHLMDKRYVG